MLFGTFHSNNSLFLLSHLQNLDLSNNDFNHSNISSRFSEFLNLRYLNLNFSVFDGLVPLEITYLSNLVSLDISQNDLTLEATTFNRLAQNLTKLRELNLNEVNMSMVAPSSLANLSSSLSSLKLGSCYLQGNFLEYVHPSNRLVSLDLSWNDLKLQTTSFSKLLQNLTNLRELDLSFVNLSSVAPSSFMNLPSSLHTLKLKYCGLQVNFIDYIHSSTLISLDLSSNYDLVLDTIMFNKLVQNIPNLREVDLSYVNMSLVEPISLMNLSSSLSSLQLWNCGLRGEFPANLLQRPNLQVLYLGYNYDLIGCLPRSNWSCSLERLSLSYTKIAIHLEGDLINNLRSVKILYLQGCNFVGSNVALFGNLRQLSELYLSSNNFSGQIPLAFGNLEHLDWLSLSFNNFSGQIPFSLANLKQLSYLYLDNNNLSGAIPNSFANLAQLRSLRLSNNQLVGPIPSQLSRLSSLISLDLSNNLLNATIPTSLFNLPYLDTLLLQRNLLMGHIS
ncbi:hypothetical protein GH714_011242 [Hevea brasiliensis]|uniref:Leucine-rich repeat-containing N-terminal plant-type domain-containing protein n=1 Tax=Hevea brasiliensis TaxID=3981 RepID=A0A6A6N0L1_HEVBR|nr:hypothetical protein GH714_011242 [Hevea brasiliensis]